MQRIILAVLLAAGLIASAGCSNAQEKGSAGAVIGGVAGGIIGHQSGHRDKGIGIGAATGAIAGYLIGNEEDKAEMKQEIRDGKRGHWEERENKVWVEGYSEKRWSPPVYETRTDADGNPYKILVEDGHYDYVKHDGYWDVRKERVWIND